MDAPLLYAGIDEAGYGPMLGPLCAGLSVFEVRGWQPSDGAPDLWERLSPEVARSPRSAEAIAIDDSKRLKGARGARAHPLTHLERGVLALLHVAGVQPTDDAALLRALGARHAELEWYGGPGLALPLTTTAEHIGLLSALVRGACARSGVGMRALRAVAVDEVTFNRELAQLESKAQVSFNAVAQLLRVVWEMAAEAPPDAPSPRVVIDRQGGRAAYAGLLGRALPDGEVVAAAENERTSRYEIEGRDSARGRRLTVLFAVEAETAHLPVALASMTAKLVRELAMERFNRYWAGRIGEIKPTAGYVQDARRWLRDAAKVITDEERRRLVRRA